MRYRIRKTIHKQFVVEIKPFLFWKSIRDYANRSDLIKDTFYRTVSTLESAKGELSRFAKVYSKSLIRKELLARKDEVIETGKIEDEVFLEKI